MSSLLNIKAWLQASRPKTLTAALVPVWLASALVFNAHPEQFQLKFSLLALLASFAIQIGTNLVNDAMDFKKGTDNSRRLGPARVTQMGVFSFRLVMTAATVFFALAVAFGLPLVLEGGWPILLIGVVSVLMGYAYTAGPYPLAYKGLGDLFVILFFGVVAVSGLSFIHLKGWSVSALILGLQVGLHAAVLIAINNLRDIENDRDCQKLTLAVRLGARNTKILIGFYIFLPFLIGAYWLSQSYLWAFVLPLLSLPLAVKITKSIWHTEPSEVYNQYLGMSAGLHLISGGLLGAGFFL